MSAQAQNLNGNEKFDLIENRFYSVMEFVEIPNAETRINLETSGIKLFDYLGGTKFLCCSSNQEYLRSNLVVGISKLKPEQRFTQELLIGNSCSDQQSEIADLIIKYLPEISSQTVLGYCKGSGLLVNKISEENRLVFVHCKKSDLQRMLQLNWIQYASCTPAKGEPEDREGRAMHRVNNINGNINSGLNLDGSGVKVLVRDDGPVGPHIDFNTRLINQTYGTDGNHGDGVSGIICGAANIDPTMGGMAPGAQLYVINYQDDFLDNTLNLHQNSGVVITNSSYSNGCNTGYTAITQIVDKQGFDNPTLLHCFSAGNSNNADCGFGAGSQWGNITGGHKIGKNVITAANLMINGIIDNSSSRGPTKDGRMKPDVSARGTNENSTDISNAYQVFGGTSAASPGVAGTAALLYQAYKEFNNQKNPPAALIKSVLMNTATDLGTQGPDYVYGYGVIDAARAYQLLKEKRYSEILVKHQENQEIEIAVPNNSALVKFMLYWPERESSLNASKVLINDIDIEVVSPSGTKILPWVLDPSPDATTLAAGAHPGIDSLNNFEQVAIQFPEAGKYKIIIKAKLIPDLAVNAFLLYDIVENNLSLSSPIGGELYNTLESSNIYFRSYVEDSIKIELSSDAGQSWRNVKTVLGSAKLTSWNIPNSINSDSCIIRLTQGAMISQSNYFTITNPITGLKIDKYCPDELSLSWAQSSKDSFIIYSLQGPVMRQISTSNTNTVTIPIQSRVDPLWFSIAGYREGVLGRRTKAIHVPDTLVKCVVTNDLSIRPKNEWLDKREFVSCGTGDIIYPEFIVYNRNVNTVNGFEINYYQGGNLITEKILKKIKYRDSLVVKLTTGITLDFNGEIELPVWINLASDEFEYNDTARINIKSQILPDKIGVYPMLETFENNKIPSDWIVQNAIPVNDWNVQEQIGKNSLPSKVVSFTNSNYSYANQAISLLTKTIDLTNSIQPYFYMDYAYNKSTLFFAYFDTLNIEILEVCSGNVAPRLLYSGSDVNLYTTTQNQDIDWIPTKGEMWNTIAIDLSNYKGKKILVRMNLIRGVYSNLYMDNIFVREKLSGTPSLDLKWTPEDICVTNIVRFTGAVDPVGSTLSWNFGLNATPKTLSGLGPHGIKYSSAGTKTVVLTTKLNGLTVISSKELKVYNTPLASFDFTIDAARIVRFTNFSTNIKTVNWNFGDGTSSSELNPTHQFDSSKIYTVTLEISNPCSTNKISLPVDLSPVGISDVEKYSISIHPNPTNGAFEIRSDYPIKQIEVENSEGQRLISETYINDNLELSMNIAHLPKGIYFVKVKNTFGFQISKIILQ